MWHQLVNTRETDDDAVGAFTRCGFWCCCHCARAGWRARWRFLMRAAPRIFTSIFIVNTHHTSTHTHIKPRPHDALLCSDYKLFSVSLTFLYNMHHNARCARAWCCVPLGPCIRSSTRSRAWHKQINTPRQAAANYSIKICYVHAVKQRGPDRYKTYTLLVLGNYSVHALSVLLVSTCVCAPRVWSDLCLCVCVLFSRFRLVGG